jgi:hypothetical protein
MAPRGPSLFGSTAGPRRWGRGQDRSITDTYKQPKKLHEPTVCPQCAAVYHEGRWQWSERPAEAHEERCPACHRTNDNLPAGVLTLSGTFLEQHKQDILNLARNQEALEKQEHPLNRIMHIEEAPDKVVITTTDIHLPRRIAEAERRAFDGKLHFAYDEDGYFLRVDWHRDT